MGARSQDRHLTDAVLHAHAAGELDAVARAAADRHLEACDACRRASARVRALVGILHGAEPPELGDARWQHISNQVMLQLRRDAEERPHLGLTHDRSRRIQVWSAAVLAAAALLALAFWTGRTTAPRPEAGTAVASAPQTRATGRDPALDRSTAEAEPEAGRAKLLGLEISDDARVRIAPVDAVGDPGAGGPGAGGTEVELEVGVIAVRAPEELADTTRSSGGRHFTRTLEGPRVITVVTPGFRAIARSRSFTIGYRAAGAFIEARDGTVRVEGSVESDGTVRAGERRVIPLPTPSAVEEPGDHGTLDRTSTGLPGDGFPRAGFPQAGFHPDLHPDLHPDASVVGHVQLTPAERAVGEPALEARELGSAQKTRPLDGAVRSSSIAATIVSVEAPSDPISRAWREASEAYYHERNLPKALAYAQTIAASERARPEVALAEEMLCDGYTAMRQAGAAVSACTVVLKRLEGAGFEERARSLHYQIGTIQRVLLGDCSGARAHYGRAVVFGRASQLDDEALLWSVHCSIELKDVEAARRDLAQLGRRASPISRPEALAELRHKFDLLVTSSAEPGSRPRYEP